MSLTKVSFSMIDGATVNVVDWGADPTGTVECHAAINAAIEHAKSIGALSVTFAPGTYLVSAPIVIAGNFGQGIVVEGNDAIISSSSTTDTIYISATDSHGTAPAARISLLLRDLTVRGPGSGAPLSIGVRIYDAANVRLDNMYITTFGTGMVGQGCLISSFDRIVIHNNSLGMDFFDTVNFSPNDIHWTNCQIISNTRALRVNNYDYGSISFIGCEIEGNNGLGNSTDGIRVCEFGNAGETNFISCHMEANPGSYNIYFVSPGGRHLNVIGCKMIPGDNCGTIIENFSNFLFVCGSQIVQNVGDNIHLNNGVRATIVGDTGGTVTGNISQLVYLNSQNEGIKIGGVAVGATQTGIGSKGLAGIAYVAEGTLQFNNSSGTRLGYVQSNGIVLDASANYSITTGYGQLNVTRTSGVGIDPGSDNNLSNGSAALRWSQVYAGNGTINTSDERAKQQIEGIPQTWLDAWGDVDYMRFKYNDAVAQKGDKARWHVGLIAQRVKQAFEARGINPFEIGLLCYDEWQDVEIEKPIEDENGVFVVDEVTKEPRTQTIVIKKAGNQYGIRYEQALALECAYLRSKLKGN